MSNINSEDELRDAVNEIRSHTREMYGDVRQINQHLDELNGQVERNAERSRKNRDWLLKGMGGLGVVLLLAQYVTANVL